MTARFSTDHPPAAPPQDYGNGDTWADDGPWAVPEDLRPYYTTASPSQVEIEGYLQNGVEVVEERSAEIARVVDPGDAERLSRVVMERITRDTLVHRQGAEYYPTWLHQKRLGLAVRAKEAADRQAAVQAAWLVCALCGIKASNVRIAEVPTNHHVVAPRLRVPTCPDHWAAADRAASRAFAQQDDDRPLPDGRRLGDVAAGVIAERMGDAS